jgi:hypothetical protein
LRTLQQYGREGVTLTGNRRDLANQTVHRRSTPPFVELFQAGRGDAGASANFHSMIRRREGAARTAIQVVWPVGSMRGFACPVR